MVADAAAAEQAVDELRLASACATEGGGWRKQVMSQAGDKSAV